MVLLESPDTALTTIINSINATTPTWRLIPFPAQWIFINGTLPNNTIVNGHQFNGSASSLNNIVVVRWREVSSIGTLPLTSFVYLIISVAVVLALLILPNFQYIARIL